MKIDDQIAFLDLAKKLGYEVQNIGPNAGMPGALAATALAQAPDGSGVVATETTTLVIVKKTTYPVKG